MTGSTSQGWTNAFAAKDETTFGEAFTDDVVLDAAVLYKPVSGREQVRTVLATASNIYESLDFTGKVVDGADTFLTWHATAFGGVPIDGVTVLTADEGGHIRHAAIYHRPLAAALRFSDTLRQRLDGVVDADYFYRAD